MLMNSPFLLWISVVLGFALFGYILSRLLKRNDVADGLWSLGFLAMAAVFVMNRPAPLTFLAWLTLVFCAIWALRLSGYLWVRLLKKGEDIRYANWRREWGEREPWIAALRVFLMQGLFMGIASLPLIWIMSASPDPELGIWSAVGSVLFLIGFIFECVADAQMAEFKKQALNQGKVLSTGVWSYCRHPNYWGEILIGWGFYFLAVQCGGGLATLAAPLLMTFLLVRVSGVPMLERLMINKGEAYTRYQKQIPALIPFSWAAVKSVVASLVIIVILDMIWLNFIMGNFYRQNLISVARLQGENWDILLWAGAAVYGFLSIGVYTFAVKDAIGRWDAIWRGSILGLMIYGVYDFTNLALLRDWPITLVLVDLTWGAFLCACSAGVGYRFRECLSRK